MGELSLSERKLNIIRLVLDCDNEELLNKLLRVLKEETETKE